MKVLMLGNSFTYFNDLPAILSAMTGWEVCANTRGGAFLREHLDAQTELGQKTLPMLQNETWDYVVLQGQSQEPFKERDAFLDSVRHLCPLVRACGATPVLYATWAYRDGSQVLESVGMDYAQMLGALVDGYQLAAWENGALIARAGETFAALNKTLDLYTPDDSHPSAAGSLLAATVIAECIRAHAKQQR